VPDLGFDLFLAAGERRREAAGMAEELEDVVGTDVERDRADSWFFRDRQRVFDYSTQTFLFEPS